MPAIANGRKRAALEPQPILAGILAATSMWSAETLKAQVQKTMGLVKGSEKLDLGCALDHGALLDRLQQIGTAPAIDLGAYFRTPR